MLDPEQAPDQDPLSNAELSLPSLEPALQAPLSSEPPGAPWDFLDLIFTLMTVFGALMIAEITGMVAISVLSVLKGGHMNGSSLTQHLSDARFVLPMELFAYLVAVTFVFLTARVKYKRSFAEAIQWRAPKPNAGFYMLAGLGLSGVSILIPAIFGTPDRHFPIEDLFKDPVSGWLLVAFGTGIAPFVEELFFRGMIYPVVARRWGWMAGVAISALLFTSIHAAQLAGALPQLGAIFFVGLSLGCARARTGSLVPGFLMHTSYNAVLFLATIIATKGFREFPT